MQIGLRQISSETAEWFKEACAGDGSGRPSRAALTRELCERESWRGPGVNAAQAQRKWKRKINMNELSTLH